MQRLKSVSKAALIPTNYTLCMCCDVSFMSIITHLYVYSSFPLQALFVCKGAAPSWMAGWRSIREERGAQSAVTDGGMKTPLWPVDSWAEGERVHTRRHLCSKLTWHRSSLTTCLDAGASVISTCHMHLQHEVFLRNLTRVWWNFSGSFREFIMLPVLFFGATLAFQTPILERYLNTISALLFTLLPTTLCPPFARTCNCVTLRMSSCQQSDTCAQFQASTYVAQMCRHFSQHRLTWTHIHLRIYTEQWVKVHREREEGKGQLRSLAKTLLWLPDVKVRTLLAQIKADHKKHNWCYITDSKVTWVLDIWYFSRMSSHARAVPLFSSENTKIHWSAVHCKGDESDLLHCPKVTWNGGECSLVAAITCTHQQGCHSLIRVYLWLKSGWMNTDVLMKPALYTA